MKWLGFAVIIFFPSLLFFNCAKSLKTTAGMLSAAIVTSAVGSAVCMIAALWWNWDDRVLWIILFLCGFIVNKLAKKLEKLGIEFVKKNRLKRIVDFDFTNSKEMFELISHYHAQINCYAKTINDWVNEVEIYSKKVWNRKGKAKRVAMLKAKLSKIYNQITQLESSICAICVMVEHGDQLFELEDEEMLSDIMWRFVAMICALKKQCEIYWEYMCRVERPILKMSERQESIRNIKEVSDEYIAFNSEVEECDSIYIKLGKKYWDNY